MSIRVYTRAEIHRIGREADPAALRSAITALLRRIGTVDAMVGWPALSDSLRADVAYLNERLQACTHPSA